MSYPTYHPVFLDLTGRQVLIVGGGKVALEKLESLKGSGARLTVLAPRVSDKVAELIAVANITFIEKLFDKSDINDQYFMVIAATNDPAVNRNVFATANAANRLANSVDDPENCNFIMAAIAKQGPMQVAVSSSGTSPAMAQQVRARVQTEILTPEVGLLADFLGRWRPRIKQVFATYQHRQGFWEWVIASGMGSVLAAEGEVEADDLMERHIEWGLAHPDCLLCRVSSDLPGVDAFKCGCKSLVGEPGGLP